VLRPRSKIRAKLPLVRFLHIAKDMPHETKLWVYVRAKPLGMLFEYCKHYAILSFPRIYGRAAPWHKHCNMQGACHMGEKKENPGTARQPFRGFQSF
jgi:hypothetical protein